MIRTIAFAVFLALSTAARAGEISVRIVDGQGRPVPDAVVSLVPQAGEAMPALQAPAGPEIIDQVNETFVPYVKIVPVNAQVVFRNSDVTRHQVYSFSPPAPFELVVVPGETSKPISFSRPGVVILGCNIHDQMIAYLYVTDRPLAVQTDKDGGAEFASVPDGNYVAHIWHPQLRPGRPEPTQNLVVSDGRQALSMTLSLMAAPAMSNMSMMNMSSPSDLERSRY